MYERVGKGLTQTDGDVKRSKQFEDKSLGKQTNSNSEIDIFPALQKYKDEHNIANLQKLCVEISEFCHSVYASTHNDTERKVYFSMLDKLNKK